MTKRKRQHRNDVAPDEWTEDGWKLFGKKEREWYIRYMKATEYGNMEILKELCDEAPTDQFERLKSEIKYERDEYRRNQYTIPTSRFPRYSELDYSWVRPAKVVAREAVEAEYYGDETDVETFEIIRKSPKHQ